MTTKLLQIKHRLHPENMLAKTFTDRDFNSSDRQGFSMQVQQGACKEGSLPAVAELDVIPEAFFFASKVFASTWAAKAWLPCPMVSDSASRPLLCMSFRKRSISVRGNQYRLPSSINRTTMLPALHNRAAHTVRVTRAAQNPTPLQSNARDDM